MKESKYINGILHHNFRFGVKGNFKVLICRIFGHRANDKLENHWCERCCLSHFEMYNVQIGKTTPNEDSLDLYSKVETEIEAISYKEFIKYGLENADNVINGYPRSFLFFGHSVDYSNKDCYYIHHLLEPIKMTSEDTLIIHDGKFYPCKSEIFYKLYSLIEK